MRGLCYLVVGATIAAALPLLLEAQLHGFGGEHALVVVENNEAAAQDVCSGDECFRRALKTEGREEQQDKPPPEFIPTHEWQDILPNQPIPPVSSQAHACSVIHAVGAIRQCARVALDLDGGLRVGLLD